MMGFIHTLWAPFEPFWNWLPEIVRDIIIIVLQIIPLLITIILMVAYLTFWERKIIGWMQNRIGPNRVGPWGLFQPFADVIKLLLKEVIVPSRSNRFLFLVAPLLALTPALAAWAVVPLFPGFSIADIDAGLLYVLALTSFGVYGVIIAGWATNSKYAFLGAMRSAAQIVAYEIAMGFALVGVLMAGGSLNLGEIVAAQAGPGESLVPVPAVPAVHRLFHIGCRGDQPGTVRRRRGRVGNRRRFPCRICRCRLCGVFSSPSTRT